MVTILLTGRPCSGKTTIGVAVRDMLHKRFLNCELLDGDIIRRNLWPELGFTREERDESVRRYGFLANMLARHNIFPIISAVSPYRHTREWLRRDTGNLIEVYVNAPPELCEQRDIKGMYKKARDGRIPDFTGVTHPYEEPLHPDVECHTDVETIEISAGKVVTALVHKIDQLIETESKGTTT